MRIKYDSKDVWLKLRKKGLGGSDISAVIAKNPYRTNLELYQEKKGLITFDNVDNRFTRYGSKAEKAIRFLFALTFEDVLKVSHTDELLVRTDKEYLRGSLDGELEVLEDFKFTSYYKNFYSDQDKPYSFELKKGMKGVLEIKTTEVLSSMSKEKWHNAIPENYYCQVLHYLNVTSYDFAIIVAELTWEDKNQVKTKETRYYGFLANDRLEDLKMLEDAADDFWLNYFEKDIEPPLKLNL